MQETTHPVIKQLLHAEAYPHPVQKLELLETHISWVVLTGDFAYKIKKPVNLGFVDFSTLDKRKHFCERELQLNRRLAASLYLSVEPIVQTNGQTVALGQNGTPVEYAVKMQQFDNSYRLDQYLLHHSISMADFTRLAETLYKFHEGANRHPPDPSLLNVENIANAIRENFSQIRQAIASELYAPVQGIQNWSENQLKELHPKLQQRQDDGFIRDCHGDLHLANMVWLNNKVVVFDCIEFNDHFRWIDVLSDLAFLIMDLEEKQHGDMANHVLNAYCMFSGDYEGLQLLLFYKVYRAMVRAKVAALTASQQQDNTSKQKQLLEDFQTYINQARDYTQAPPAKLLITYGLSGSGKSTVAALLAARLPAIHIRSDVERKRLAGIDVYDSSESAADAGVYTAEMTDKTYHRLLHISRTLIKNAYSVIVDATFLEPAYRTLFRELAADMNIGFFILGIRADEDILFSRIRARSHQNDAISEADEKILRKQLADRPVLLDEEIPFHVDVDTNAEPDYEKILKNIRKDTNK